MVLVFGSISFYFLGLICWIRSWRSAPGLHSPPTPASGSYLRPTHETRYAGKSCFASLKLPVKLQYFSSFAFPAVHVRRSRCFLFHCRGKCNFNQTGAPPAPAPANSAEILFKSLTPNSLANLHFVLFLRRWRSERKCFLNCFRQLERDAELMTSTQNARDVI